LARAGLTRPTDGTLKRLFARSGNRCAFPKCTVEIVQGETLVGEVCHIKAARPGGPRYDADQTSADRHGYDNLILLCGTHHTVVDDDDETYTVERLIKMKTDHEQRATPIPEDRAASATQLLIHQSVSAINQSGGIAAHTVNIYGNQASARPAQSSVPQPTPFPGATPKDGPARFRAQGDAIGIRDDRWLLAAGIGNSISLATGPAMWLRLMPALDPSKTWTPYELGTVRGHGLGLQPFLWGSVTGHGGLYTLRAEDGVGSCSLIAPEACETNSVAFAFDTGEVWAIDTWALGAHPNYLFPGPIEELCARRLPEYAQFLASLGLNPPYRWIAGVTGVKDRLLQPPPPPGGMYVPGWRGPQCLSEAITAPGTYDGIQTPTNALLPFFKALYEKCGLLRPDYLPR
jgi:hypothetical protein